MLSCKFGNGFLVTRIILKEIKKKMKKVFLVLISVYAVIFTSCLSLDSLSPAPRVVEFPETDEATAEKLVAYEKAKDYRYSFTAVNYGNAEAQVVIYDDKYMKITYPEIEKPFFYYYKFTGDYLDHMLSNKRLGIFGYAANLITGDVVEIVFRNPIHGGYKFKSIRDAKYNDKSYASGNITWNSIPEATISGTEYYLEFFESRDKKLSSKTDEFGNKKDLAGKLYFSVSPVETSASKWR